MWTMDSNQDRFGSEDIEQSSLGSLSSANEPQLSAGQSAQLFGRTFIDGVYKILKVSSIYSVEHNQTRQAIEEFLPFFYQSIQKSGEESVSLTIRGELVSVNGETLRLKRREQERLNELHSIFAAADIRGLRLEQTMTAVELVALLKALGEAGRAGQGMMHVEIPSIHIDHGSPDQSVLEAIASVNKSMYVAHVYI